MKVFFHNFNPQSNSGPNKFTRQMAGNLIKRGKIEVTNSQEDADVEFCLIQRSSLRVKPSLLRLDGIYFNNKQDFLKQNEPIKFSYKTSDAIVFQSKFNEKLTKNWWGPHDNTCVIHNMPDLEAISHADPSIFDNFISKDVDVWSCASAWRPHKRLSANLEYFCEKADKESVMIVAGKDSDKGVIDKYNKEAGGRIFSIGELNYFQLLSLYKRSSHFVHLAFLDHCPNVVVDAQASDCKIVCASSGGTSEIVSDGLIVKDIDWNLRALDLYNPPTLDYDNFTEVLKPKDKNNNIENAANLYYNALMEIQDEQ